MPDALSKMPAPGPENSLRLKHEALVRLLEELDGPVQAAELKRGDSRRPFRERALAVTLMPPGGGRVTLHVATRNLSSSGMSVLHSAFVYPGTAFESALPTLGGAQRRVAGTVARCNHLRGTYHEVGLRFDEPVTLREFVRIEEGQTSLETIEPDRLHGCVVHIEDNELDHLLLKHALRETMLRVRHAATAEIARDLVGQGCDLVILDYHLGSSNGADLVDELVRSGANMPMVMLTADTSAAAARRVERSAADAVLHKPFTPADLMRTLGEYLLIRDDARPIKSTLSPDDPTAGLAESFASEVREHAAFIRRAIEAGEPESCLQVCCSIRSNAKRLGFELIDESASVAVNMLSGQDASEAVPVLHRLARLCRRAAGPFGSAA